MASRASNLCLDAADPWAQTLWWSKVLEDFTLPEDDDQGPGDDECGLVGPDDRYLLFLWVPEPKQVKNRMHLCLRPTDRSRDEEVERLLQLGAELVADERKEDGSGWVTLRDPDGYELCVQRSKEERVAAFKLRQ